MIMTTSTNIFISLLRELRVPFTESFTLHAYEEHPYKYTFFGLKTLCDRYGIEAKGVFFHDKESLLTLSVPFIVSYNNDYALVKKVGEQVTIEMYGSDIKLQPKDFIDNCTGHALIFHPDRNSIEPDYKRHLLSSRISRVEYSCMIICGVALLTISLLGRPLPMCIGLVPILLSLLGCVLSGMLLTQQMKVHNPLVESVCHAFKASTCNNVLESSAAKILGKYSWAEIGFAYFSVNLISLVVSDRSQETLAYIAALSLLYSIWSIWYQHRISQWCPICLMVQGVVLVQFVCYLFGGFYIQIINLDIKVLVSIISAYICGTLIIHKLLPLLSLPSQLLQAKWQYNHLKMNQKVFDLLLHEGTKYNTVNTSVEFGEPSSDMVVTVFSNPYCNPCAAMHQRLQKIYSSSSCRIRYVFTSFKSEWNNINRCLIAVYQQHGAEKAWEAYTEWYESGKHSQEHFFDKYHLDLNSDEIEREFQQHEQWKNATKFNATPTILVNGYKLPYGYTIEDMQYLS